MATTNYKLPTITGNMTSDVVRDMNALAEATDSAIKEAVDGVDLTEITQEIGKVDTKLTQHLAETNTNAHKAKSIVLDDVDGLFVGTELETAMKELFINVSNGKDLIGTAITDVDPSKVVPSNPTFQQLVDLISGITTGKEFATGNGSPGGNGLIVTGLTFRPGIILVQRQGHGNQFNSAAAFHADIPNFKMSMVVAAGGGNGSGNSVNVTITNNGFTMKGVESGWPHNWLAIE